MSNESNFPQFWHVSYPRVRESTSGMTLHQSMTYVASNEQSARAQAQAASLRHGHATVTNRAGLVATYVNGEEWRPPR